jgi:ribosomal protein L11 methylase PrmA
MGLFVSFIPTATDEVGVFFDLAPVTKDDVVYDLGSGDGRVLFAALDRGAGRAVGIELNETRVGETRELAAKKGLSERAAFVHADIMDVDLSGATVIVCYLYSTASAALKPKFEAELKPGARVVMESFPVHGWRPVEVVHLPARTFYLYRMPPEPER